MDGRLDSPLGPMLFQEKDGAVTVLRFAAAGESEALTPAKGALAQRTAEWLARYFAGENPLPDLPLAPVGTAFQYRVWRETCAIPYGETLSYGELARRVGCGSARAVGAALGKNPVWLLIPCHRVVGSNGALTGYAGGLRCKAALLDLEKNK